MDENLRLWGDFAARILADDPGRASRLVWSPDEASRLEGVSGGPRTRILKAVVDLWERCGAEEGHLSPIDWAVEEMLDLLEQTQGQGAVLNMLSCFDASGDGTVSRSVHFGELVKTVAEHLKAAPQVAPRRKAGSGRKLRDDVREILERAWVGNHKRSKMPTQEAIAQRLGVDKRTVAFWMAKDRAQRKAPGPRNAEALAAAFGLKKEEILEPAVE